MKKSRPYVLILASGGMDSTACINFYKNLKFDVEALFVDYGQLSLKQELKAVKLICEHYKIKLDFSKLISNRKYNDGLIIGRNAFLCFTALMNFKKDKGVIALGIHKGTEYYDCSEQFPTDLQKIFNGYSKESIIIETPFIQFNKIQIYNYCCLENIPFPLTYSCEKGRKKPCGKCATCKDLKVIYASKKF